MLAGVLATPRFTEFSSLTLSWWRSLLYRNQSIHLLCESMDCFLYDKDLHNERVNFLALFKYLIIPLDILTTLKKILVQRYVNIRNLDTRKIHVKDQTYSIY